MAKTFMDKGALVPDDVISALIINELKLMKQHSWLLDGKDFYTLSKDWCWPVVYDNLSSLESTGFPRTLKQAETLQQSESVNVVISLDVPEDEIVQR